MSIAWNRYYDDVEIYALLDRLAAEWPALLSYEVIGHSFEGRELRQDSGDGGGVLPDSQKRYTDSRQAT